MKKRRWPLWVGLGLLLFVGGVLVLTPLRWQVVGWLRGEAFYKARPASWWEDEIQRNVLSPADGIRGSLIVTPSRLWWQRLIGWFGAGSPNSSETDVVCELLHGRQEAVPVLGQLMGSRYRKVRGIAIFLIVFEATREVHQDIHVRPAFRLLCDALSDDNEDIRRQVLEAVDQTDSAGVLRAELK